MVWENANYYASNTDVWVLGSPAQYSAFARLLTAQRIPLRIPADERGGMDLLILPPAQNATRDFVVLHERLVHQNGRFNMELILGASTPGFKYLARVFRKSARYRAGNTDDHVHFDCLEEILLLPSVYLNIRGPIDEIESQLCEIAPPAPDDLPSGMEWQDPEAWSYSPIEGYGSLFVRLPMPDSCEPGDSGFIMSGTLIGPLPKGGSRKQKP